MNDAWLVISASRYLEFAVKFTPQYGDSFIELMRLVILSRGDAERLRLVEQVRSSSDFALVDPR